jgi:hypothetical protein
MSEQPEPQRKVPLHQSPRRPRARRREFHMLPDSRFSIECFCAVTLLVSPFVAGCGSDPSCAETATCAPVVADAQSDQRADDGGSGAVTDAAYDSDARDVSVVNDGSDSADRRDALHRDAAKDGDAAPDDDADPIDSADANNDVADTGANDARGGGHDASSDADAPWCDVDAGRSPTSNPCIVSERYGVFVSPAGSDATGAGTRAAPYRTINRALQAANAETRRVFACDDGSGYAEPIVIDVALDGLALFGGFECNAWTLAPNVRTRVRPLAGPALSVDGLVKGVVVENFDLFASDAAVGASSIAVQVRSSLQVVVRSSRIHAGKGGPGQAGANGPPGEDGAPVGPDQRGFHATCVPPTVSQPGGIAFVSACGSKGGNGGAFDTTLGSLPGETGLPLTFVDPPNRPNGAADWLHDHTGGKGSDGVAGGPGTVNPNIGAFAASGYTAAAAGGDGEDGRVAQGGGGGSAGQPEGANVCTSATGGAGGSGGCGGLRGRGGSAGGASVALLSWMSGVTLDKCEVVAADGGTGGHGGHGGLGGKGSAGAAGGEGVHDLDGGGSLAGAGPGGAGGQGGPGGGGAGGNGGPSYAIVYAGGRPSQIGGTTVARGLGGVKGFGGLTGVTVLGDGGAPDAAAPDGATVDGGAGWPDGGSGGRAPDGLPGEAAYELAIP